MLTFNNKQIFFAQNVTSAPANPCTVWDIMYAGTTPCYVLTGTSSALGTQTYAKGVAVNGTKLFTISGIGTTVMFEYDLATAWDVTDTITFNSSKDFGGENLESFNFASDGQILVIGTRNSSNGRVNSYLLSSAWDISTAGSALTTGALGYYVTSVNLLSGGTRLVTTDGSYYRRQYSLSTPYDVSTASLIGSIIYPPTLERRKLFINSGGTDMYGQSSGSDMYHYKLTTPYDISTASLQSGLLNVSSSNWDGYYFRPDGTGFYGMEFLSAQVDWYLFSGD